MPLERFKIPGAEVMVFDAVSVAMLSGGAAIVEVYIVGVTFDVEL